MPAADCFFCGHVLSPAFSEQACPNCGAPVNRQAEAPASSKATRVLFPVLWPINPDESISRQALGAPKTTGLLGAGRAYQSGRPTEREAIAASEPAPISMEGRPGTLEGQVDTPPTKSTVDVPLEWWSQGTLRLLFPPLFTMLSRYLLVAGPQDNGTPTPQPKPTMTVYTVRVRRDDQTLGEARLEGDLIEGEPSLGDRLALHGHYRGNTLVVDEGYNQSFHPPMRIKIRPPLPRKRARVAVVVLAVALLAATGLFCTFLPLFATHGGTFRQASALQQVLLHYYYLGAGIALGLLAFCLYSLSGIPIRILMAVFVLIAGLAVYVALGGTGIPPFPLHW